MRPKSIQPDHEYPLNNGGWAIATEYINSKRVRIVTDTGYKTTVRADQINNGNVLDPFAKTTFGIGYFGERFLTGNYTKKELSRWKKMFERCYSSIYLLDHPECEGLSIDPEWHNFSNFVDWSKENYVEGYQLDRNILSFGNKVYGPKTCIYAPRKIAYFFNGNAKSRGELSLGVSNRTDYKTNSFRASGTNKSFKSEEEAKAEYWRVKRGKLDELIKEFPKFEVILIDCFDMFKERNNEV